MALVVEDCPRPFSAKAVANWFLDLGSPLNPMKIQKLVYFAHGWELGLKGRPLINERVEAWPYGPVVPSLYHEFKVYGSGTITEPASSVEATGSKLRFVIPAIPVADTEARALLAKIWDVYGHRTGPQLSAMTHIPGSPWHTVSTQNPGVRSVDIPDDLIQRWFSDLAQRNVGNPERP